MVGLIVHEWLEQFGGSENVVSAMVDSFPTAEIRCLWDDAPGRFPGSTVSESWLAKTPLRHCKAAAVPLMPSTWAAMDVTGYDWLLVSSHLFAHHVGGALPPDGPRKFVYVHTPARYIWAPEHDPRGRHPVAKLLSPVLRRTDRRRASTGSLFAANSDFIRQRVREHWDQDARVIYPPVRVEHLQSVEDWRTEVTGDDQRILDQLPSEFLLGASRFIDYKRLDVVIKAGEATGTPVVLAGSGSGAGRATLHELAAAASVPVQIIDRPSDALLFALFQLAEVFVFPSVEDFGIMPVESIALGTPALVYSDGGAKESVEELAGGAVMESYSADSLRRGLDEALRADLHAAKSKAAGSFGNAAFASRLQCWMSEGLR